MIFGSPVLEFMITIILIYIGARISPKQPEKERKGICTIILITAPTLEELGQSSHPTTFQRFPHRIWGKKAEVRT